MQRPQISGGISPAEVFPPERLKRDPDTLDSLLLATGSDQNNQPSPVSAEKAQALLATAREKLQKEYGDQLQMFNNLGSEKVDREKVCEISISLFSDILALPVEQSAAVLRMM